MKSKKNILIALLIILNIILLIIGVYAYAKYRVTIFGTENATTASWNFKVNNSSSQIETIDLADTITSNIDKKVTEGKIAPGTEGAINLVLDASATDVNIGYKIQIGSFVNKPTNLEFYSDSSFTEPLELIEGTININGSIPLEQTQLTHTIYWKWPYELGYTEQEINQNDIIDSQDSGKEVTCTINITGEQILKLVNQVEIGDYVNYDASSGIAATYTTDESLTGSSEISTFSSSDEMEWRVLSKNTQTGEVTLVSSDVTENICTLTGAELYINAETVLNGIGAVYGHGKGAIEGRSITLEDIEQYLSYDKTTYVNPQGYAYGDTKTFIEGNFINEDGTVVTATSTNPVTVTQTGYNLENVQNYCESAIVNNILFGVSNDSSQWWIASRRTAISDEYYFYTTMHFNEQSGGRGDIKEIWGVRAVSDSWLEMPLTPGWYVRPVVSLQPNIYTTGQDSNGVWQLFITE